MRDKKIREFIIIYFLERKKFAEINQEEMTLINFIETNMLDSIEFITLISELEENFNIVFTEEDIQSPLFSSIDGMAKIAGSKTQS